jgi:hypothetical protein
MVLNTISNERNRVKFDLLLNDQRSDQWKELKVDQVLLSIYELNCVLVETMITWTVIYTVS